MHINKILPCKLCRILSRKSEMILLISEKYVFHIQIQCLLVFYPLSEFHLVDYYYSVMVPFSLCRVHYCVSKFG